MTTFRTAAGGIAARLDNAMWFVLATAAIFAFVAVADVVALLRIIAVLPSPPLGDLQLGQRLGTYETLLFYFHLLFAGVWYYMCAALVRSRGAEPVPVLTTWTVVAWRTGVVATVAAGLALPHASLVDGHWFELRLEWMIPLLLARVALAALFVVAVFGLRRRMHEVLSSPPSSP
ncbi:hypothetical protein ACQP2P_15375 [Dactylosporangium sp. CA-139114]|uniref:hypothetical protein n=1 Tax=Dactylosporangium sp. CA-139114 TaxID=3239931 RepID=UPI003D9513FA